MSIERKRQKQSPDFGPLIDPNRTVYQNQTYTPNITFWGFYHLFCSGSLALIFTSSQDTGNERLDFLKQAFQNTSVDPWKYVFKSGQAKSTTANLLAKLWHLSWKYERPQKSFEEMLRIFRVDPELTLNGIVRNLTKLVEHGQIDCNRAGRTAFQLLRTLYPNRFSGPKQPETERSLALLLLICLLGDDVVLSRQRLNDVAEWLDREKFPSGFFMGRLFQRTGLYNIDDAEINTKLLPSIVCEGKQYHYRVDSGSPLKQIISEQQYRWIYLSGQSNEAGDSTVSGTGKTTSLRFLALEEKETKALWLPLAEIYAHRNLKDAQVLSRHINTKFHVDLEELPESTLLLLDGLDELIDREQLEQLSEDLYMLQHMGKFGLIVSSKLPWEQLPRVDTFYNWSSVWQIFQSCTIQTLSEGQIKAAASQYDIDEFPPQLNTPFHLSLYLQTASLPDDPWTTTLIRRWRAEKLFSNCTLTKELLFYRSLIVQIIRWHESAPGRDMQWEMDAFLLLHTLPAIACQMLRSERNDPDLDPESAVTIDQEFVKRMIDATRKVSSSGLSLFPGYSKPGQKYEPSLKGLSYQRFLSGAIPSLFHGEWDGEDQLAQPRFVNFSLRDNLAFLHIANVFLLAQKGKLDMTVDAVEAYGHTVEMTPVKQLQKIAAFFNLIAEEKLTEVLRKGPDLDIDSPLSRFLAGQIASFLCEYLPEIRRDKSISSKPWYECMVSAFQQIEQISDTALRELAIKRFSLAYIYGQVTYAKNFRISGEYELAEQCADQVLRFNQKENTWLINSDGYPMKANILLEQVRLILNSEYKGTPRPIPASELEFAFELTDELKRMIFDPQVSHSILKDSSKEQSTLIPIFSMMLDKAKLKWDTYAEREFFQSPVLEYLCSASYLAKAYCVAAALSLGNSGLAYNLLGSMAENDNEMFENSKNLSFFKKNPKLHLDILDLAYEDRFVASFQIYQQIYNIRRGQQPYPARRVSEPLLRRQVRLDKTCQPIPAVGNEPFTKLELDYLDQATNRAVLNQGSSELYWRARYLHEFAMWDQDAKQFEERIDKAKRALQKVWKKNSCEENRSELKRSRFKAVDFVSFLVILEDFLMNPPDDKTERDVLYNCIFAYLSHCQEEIQTEPYYTTGSCVRHSDIQDCLARIDRLKLDSDSFVVHHLMTVHHFSQK